MGMVSAQREVLRFVGMGAVQKSPPRGVVVLISHTQEIQGDSTVTSLQYARDFELELELIQTQMAQKPMLRAEVGMRVRCANKASAE